MAVVALWLDDTDRGAHLPALRLISRETPDCNRSVRGGARIVRVPAEVVLQVTRDTERGPVPGGRLAPVLALVAADGPLLGANVRGAIACKLLAARRAGRDRGGNRIRAGHRHGEGHLPPRVEEPGARALAAAYKDNATADEEAEQYKAHRRPNAGRYEEAEHYKEDQRDDEGQQPNNDEGVIRLLEVPHPCAECLGADVREGVPPEGGEGVSGCRPNDVLDIGGHVESAVVSRKVGEGDAWKGDTVDREVRARTLRQRLKGEVCVDRGSDGAYCAVGRCLQCIPGRPQGVVGRRHIGVRPVPVTQAAKVRAAALEADWGEVLSGMTPHTGGKVSVEACWVEEVG
mmetsp:Transcript_46433/g.132346  ORF Transcript_46433/g.132346 Transcript_46433/m.132346 type:complete len:345 (+) Transcript_46433:1313-2347(+)